MITLLYFSADWCSPCKSFKPIVEKLVNENRDMLELKILDVEVEQELSAKYKIKSLPTIVCIQDGNILNQFSGTMKKEELINKIKDL